MDALIGWAIFAVTFVFPLLHVALTRDMMTRPDDGACPFSPRAGWLVLVLFLGPIGWLMFIHARHRRRRTARPPANA